jgi:hypothetical protein
MRTNGGLLDLSQNIILLTSSRIAALVVPPRHVGILKECTVLLSKKDLLRSVHSHEHHVNIAMNSHISHPHQPHSRCSFRRVINKPHTKSAFSFAESRDSCLYRLIQHPGLIGTAPSAELLEMWNDRGTGNARRRGRNGQGALWLPSYSPTGLSPEAKSVILEKLGHYKEKVEDTAWMSVAKKVRKFGPLCGPFANATFSARLPCKPPNRVVVGAPRQHSLVSLWGWEFRNPTRSLFIP